MASYSIEFRPSVQKDFRSIPKEVATRLWSAIESLASEPLPKGTIKLAGSEHLYRIRVSSYRIVYSINNDINVITVHHVRHRSEIYRRM
jgi:mRNA interferase RelE/StbE